MHPRYMHGGATSPEIGVYAYAAAQVKKAITVAIFLIQRNRHALIGRAIDDHDMKRVLELLKNDPVKLHWIILLKQTQVHYD
uniref:xylose isomerase n=1 Tax=Helianthus annuus TaxID=4232 RepID=A0A251TGC2_HELAN